MIPFPFNENRFSFFVADHQLVGQLCTNPKSDRSLLSRLKVTQCLTREITPKCTWMCWRVWWSPGAIKWPVADPGCGSRTRCQPTSPKRLRLGFRRSATSLYPFLTGPLPPLTRTRWTTSFGHTLRSSPTWTPTTPKPAWSPPSTELSPVLVKKARSQFQIRIKAVIEAESGYIE